MTLTGEKWITEHKFHPDRRWRFDVAHTGLEAAVEIEGGLFIRGRHSRGAGMLKDMEKYNAAARMGWIVFRYAPSQVSDGSAAREIAAWMKEIGYGA